MKLDLLWCSGADRYKNKNRRNALVLAYLAIAPTLLAAFITKTRLIFPPVIVIFPFFPIVGIIG